MDDLKIEKLSDKSCEVCGCPPNHETHMLPTYREHNYDPMCCVEYLMPEVKRLNDELEEAKELSAANFGVAMRFASASEGHRVSDEMLDSVVKYAGRIEAVCDRCYGAMWVFLNELGVYQCWKCEGHGGKWTTEDETTWFVCPACNGHGWVPEGHGRDDE